MRSQNPILILIFMLPWMLACETPTSHSAEMWGSAVAKARDQMLTKRLDQEPMGVEGPTAAGIVKNYHYNQDSENRRETIKDLGLIDLSRN